jgi:hypothetical protein
MVSGHAVKISLDISKHKAIDKQQLNKLTACNACAHGGATRACLPLRADWRLLK